MQTLITYAYLLAAALFIIGIKRLNSPARARRGNQIAAVGMLIAVLATLVSQSILAPWMIVGGLTVGTALGWLLAARVRMTQMPEMVAALNGLGGGASVLVAWAEQYVPSGPAALLNATTPAWVVLFEWLTRKRRRPALVFAAALGLGLGGVGLLVNGRDSDGALPRVPAVALVGASVAWAAGTLRARSRAQGDPARDAADQNAAVMARMESVSLAVLAGFDPGAAGFQFREQADWVPAFGIQYKLGVDGISLLFILLNSFVTILVVIAGWSVIDGGLVVVVSLLPPEPMVQPPSKLGPLGRGPAGFVVSPHPATSTRAKVVNEISFRIVARSPPMPAVGGVEESP